MNLQGSDALNKANKLMESMATSQKKDSYSNVESKHLAYDGKYYGVVKENTMYVLKVATSQKPLMAEDFDYINGVQNKSHYSRRGYNDIMKMYNLMNIEMKRSFGDELMNEALEREHVALVNEQKFVLKVKKKSNEPINEPLESPTDDLEQLPVDDSIDSEEELGGELDSEDSLENSEESSENPDDYSDIDPDNMDTEDPEKMIQKLSGKLAYELREFDDEEKYSDTAKFAMSMTTAALDTTKISDEDKKSIENKLSSKFEDSLEDSLEDSQDENLDDFGGNASEEDLGEGVFETKSALDNLNVKIGSFAVDEPVLEMKMSKEALSRILAENKIMFEVEEQDMSNIPADKILFDEDMSIDEFDSPYDDIDADSFSFNMFSDEDYNRVYDDDDNEYDAYEDDTFYGDDVNIGDLDMDNSEEYTLESEDILTDTEISDFPEEISFGQINMPNKKRNPFIYKK